MVSISQLGNQLLEVKQNLPGNTQLLATWAGVCTLSTHPGPL